MKRPHFVRIADACPSIRLDIRYATHDNFLGFPMYSLPECFVHQDAADKLIAIQRKLQKKSLGLKIYDGYRPLSVQQLAWDKIQDERYVSNPAKNRGRHTRGTAVDVTLVDSTGIELEMPTLFDEFCERAHSDAVQDISQQALVNRALLTDMMAQHGFEQLPTEWWHFDLAGWDDDVRYPAYSVSFEELLKG